MSQRVFSLCFIAAAILPATAFSPSFLTLYKGTPYHDSRYQGGPQKMPGRVLCAYYDLGGEGVATDSQGNVYITAGQIYVYSPRGKLIDTVEVPERPIQLVFGGSDGHTLFIPAGTSLYAVRTRFRGRRE